MPEPNNRDLLISDFTSALHGKSIELLDRPDRGSPLPSWARLHSRLSRAFRYTIDSFDKLIAKREEEEWGRQTSGLHQEAVDALEDVIYAAAEVFSFYESDIPYYLNLDSHSNSKIIKSRYINDIKEQKRFSSAACNACKHNHNFLVPVEAKYHDGSISVGYSIYSRSGNVLSVNRQIVHDGGAFSFRRTLINILARILLADHYAGKLVNALPETPASAPIDCSLYKLPYMSELQKISSLPDIGMPGEHPSFEFHRTEDGLINITRDTDPTNYEGKHGPASLSLLMLFLGNDAHFEAPFTGENFRVQMAAENGSPSPIAAEMRIDLRDHHIPARE